MGTRITGTLAARVLLKSLFYIHGDAGIDRAVLAFEEIEVPGHVFTYFTLESEFPIENLEFRVQIVSRRPPQMAKKAKKKSTKKKTTSKRKPNAAFMKALTPSAKLAAVVGTSALPRTQVVKKLWVYIKKHKLQNPKNMRNILADEKLKEVFGGKREVSMFEMTKPVCLTMR